MPDPSDKATVLCYRASRPGYLPGDVVLAGLRNLEGRWLGEERFIVISSPGGGFAGQVYRAEPVGKVLFPGAGPDKPPWVALKVLRPRGPLKMAIRDFLFRLCYQAEYAPRYREEALRAGLLWQEILRRAAGDAWPETGSTAVTRPLGYYWDAEVASYVEVQEWIDGRGTVYWVDPTLLPRRLHGRKARVHTEMGERKRFMDRIARLCKTIGMTEVARQFEWFTGVSQLNVLIRSSLPGETLTFTAVDCRPGLAFPFFFPFTLVHARQALAGIFRGQLAHFAETDRHRLIAYLSKRPLLASALDPLLSRLRLDETRAAEELPNLWNTGPWSLFKAATRSRIREAAVEDWKRAGWVDPSGELRGWAYLAALALRMVPFLGTRLLSWAANPAYRRHCAGLLLDRRYRQVAIASWKAADLPEWIQAGRIPPGGQPGAYILQKIFLSGLPAWLHRLFVDVDRRRQVFYSSLVQPLKLMIDQATREAWLLEILHREVEQGSLGPVSEDALQAQIREPRMAGFVRDLGFTAGLDLFSRLFYLGLGAYGLSSGDFIPLGLAALGPIPPSGLLRGLYVLIQTVLDLPEMIRQPDRRWLYARLAALAVSPWRWVGNLFAVFEISLVYPWLALTLGKSYATRLAAFIPVFGGRGKLLEYWLFQLFYSLPVGILQRREGGRD